MFILSLGLLLVFGSVGCSGISDSGSVVSPSYPDELGNGGSNLGANPELGSDAELRTGDREVISRAFADLFSENPAKSADELSQLVERYQGRVEQKNLYTDFDGVPIRATLVLRVPPDKLGSVLDALPDIGAIHLLEVESTDVTVSVRDFEARVLALETSVGRLLELLERATTTSDLIEIEYALTQRQSELDGLKSTLNYYLDAVGFATLTVNVLTQDQSPINPPDDFWQGLVVGWQSLVGFLSGLVVVSAIAIPWLGLIIVPLSLLTWWFIRGKKMKKLRRAQSSTQ